MNDANYPIQVIYKVKSFSNAPQTLEVEPRVVSAADVEQKERYKWTKLTPNQFKLDQLNRTVTITLHAHDALWITSMHNYSGDDDRNSFPIEEISIRGAAGEMTFTGDRARQAFQYVSRNLYKLTYK